MNQIMTLYGVLSVFILLISVLLVVSPNHRPSADKQVTQTSQCEELKNSQDIVK